MNKILCKYKYSSIPPLIENDKTVTDPKEKSDILNSHFAQKATVDGDTDVPPDLEPTNTFFSILNQINTSPLEVSELLRDIKSHTSNIVESKVNFYL